MLDHLRRLSQYLSARCWLSTAPSYSYNVERSLVVTKTTPHNFINVDITRVAFLFRLFLFSVYVDVFACYLFVLLFLGGIKAVYHFRGYLITLATTVSLRLSKWLMVLARLLSCLFSIALPRDDRPRTQRLQALPFARAWFDLSCRRKSEASLSWR